MIIDTYPGAVKTFIFMNFTVDNLFICVFEKILYHMGANPDGWQSG